MDELIPTPLNLLANHQAEILNYASQLAPIEVCGIIAGDENTSQKIYPISNTLNSPVEYLMDAKQMLQAFWDIEKNGWEVLAFFHSHPHSRPFPSPTDLSRNYYPHTPHVIAGKIESRWVLKAFQLLEHTYNEIPIVTLPTQV